MTTLQIQNLDKSLYNSRSRLNTRKWSFASFQKRFSRYFPELTTLDNSHMRDCLKIVGIQNDINKILRKRGMVIKSRNYYSEFIVVEKPDLKVAHIDTKISRLRDYRNELNLGLFAYGNSYSARLSVTELESISGESSVRVARIRY